MINNDNMINAAFKANKQQLSPASTSQSAATSDPIVTIPGLSSHITTSPAIVPSATDSNLPGAYSAPPFNEILSITTVSRVIRYFGIEVKFNELNLQACTLESLMVYAKQQVYRKRFVKLWMNDVRKATIKFGDIQDEMGMEMSRLQAQGHEFDSAETRSVRRRMLLKVQELCEEQKELIKRASVYELGTNNSGGLLQCGTCGSLQANHSTEAVPTYACY